MSTSLKIGGLLVAWLLVVVTAENRLQQYETECKLELGSALNPCLRACQMQKLGIMPNGVFDLNRALMKVDEVDGFYLYPEGKRDLLKSVIKNCHREVLPENGNPCTAATAMYYCVSSSLESGRSYQLGEGESYRKMESVRRDILCRGYGSNFPMNVYAERRANGPNAYQPSFYPRPVYQENNLVQPYFYPRPGCQKNNPIQPNFYPRPGYQQNNSIQPNFYSRPSYQQNNLVQPNFYSRPVFQQNPLMQPNFYPRPAFQQNAPIQPNFYPRPYQQNSLIQRQYEARM